MVGLLDGLHLIQPVGEPLDLLPMMEPYLDKNPHLQMTQLDLKMLWCVLLYVDRFLHVKAPISCRSSKMMIALCINF